MALKERILEDMKAAMRAKEAGKVRLATIRMVRSAIRQQEIDGKKELDDTGVIAVVAKEVKSRRESLADFKKGGREDLVARTEEEIATLLPYLPQQLTEAELKDLVAQAIQEAGATSAKDMGKVMALLMPKVKGRADGKAVSAAVRALLS